jgi:hypothetical protein
MTVKVTEPDTDAVAYTIRFPRPLYARLHQLARHWDLSHAKAILRAIEEVCEEHVPAEPPRGPHSRFKNHE